MSSSSWKKSLACGVSAIALSLGLGSAASANDPYLPGLTNLNFNLTTSGGPVTPKCGFSSCGLKGWTGGNGLIYVDSTVYAHSAAGGGYLTTYGNPTPNLPGNYVQADGNPVYESGFNYLVHGLTVGQTYQLNFYQGASQQTGFHGPTTNQWIVSLGTAGLYDYPIGGRFYAYANTDLGASIAASPLMSVPDGGTVGWEPQVTVYLTADATTDLLSFLAWGDNGNTANLPPIAFLAGVDSPPGLQATPLPGALPLLGVGLAGLAAIGRRRRKQPIPA